MITPEKLAQVKDFDSLAALFYSNLNWPQQTWRTFDGVADLYDIDLENAKSIQAVQPLDDSQDWGIFLLDFGDDALKRRDLRAALTKLAIRNRQRHDNPVWHHDKLLFICRHSGSAFTFAYFSGDRLANAKLRSFGWDDAYRARTPITRNLPKLAWECRSNWQSAWDAEALTKEFFRDYKTVFEQVEASVIGLDTAETKRRFTQTLFNRLMFLAFLQEKGWLKFGEQRKDYLYELRDAFVPHRVRSGHGMQAVEARFYDRLRLLFFSGLNARSDGGKDQLIPVIGVVPFLNGGLFDPDPFLDLAQNYVPDESIDAILKLFKRYTFTVTESTPLDVEVALDPEMLGKIFEELVTGRHESGSYYTPRPVVQYMCREGIKGYLGGYEKLVDEHDPDGIGIREAKQLIQKLEAMKVCDPACGSGAYLLGMLQEIHALQVLLDTTAEQKDARDDYKRKIKIIGDCLYGVDIDPFAVNIAWLRLWLALIIDDERNPVLHDVSLPNLDAKIEVGDSLMGLGPADAQFRTDRQEVLRLKALKDEYCMAHSKSEKERLRNEMIATKQVMRRIIGVQEFEEQSKVDNYFDWIIEFGEAFVSAGGASASLGGFDVVLANPPYIRQEEIRRSFGDEYKRALVRAYPDSGSGTADLYVYFYDRALQLLATGGMLVYISSNKWFKAAYGEKLRKTMAEKTRILSITDFGELPVFETAATFPMIFVARKEQTAEQSPTFTQVKSLDPPYPDVAALIAEHGSVLPKEAMRGGEWTLADAETLRRIERMKSVGVPLGEYVKGKIYYGIKTGFNEAFVIDGAKRAELIAEDPKSAEIIKPLAVGDDIRRWHIRKRDRWLIVTKIGVDMSRYPVIMRHLSQYQDNLEKRHDKGNHWWELRACAYYDEFEHNKIIYPVICKEPRFACDLNGTFTNDKCFIIPVESSLLVAVLNSTVVWELLRTVCSALGDAQDGGRLELRLAYMADIPIPEASDTDREALTSIVRRILHLKGCEETDAFVEELRKGHSKDIDMKSIQAVHGETNIREQLVALEAEMNQRIEFLYFHRNPANGVDNYDEWVANRKAEIGTPIGEIRTLINQGESGGVEFKQSLEAVDLTHPRLTAIPESQRAAKIAETRKELVFSVLKTIGAFRNRNEGGTLLIGVSDDGDTIGLQPDYELLGRKKDKDGFENKLTDLIKTRISPLPTGLDITFAIVDGKEICVVKVRHGPPTYVDNRLYIRLGNSSEELTGRDLQDWLDNRPG